GNTADDWARVRVTDGFDWRRVRQCQFFGDVVLGRFTGVARLPEGVELPTGVYHSTVVDSVIGHEALVRDVRMLAHYVVGPSAVVVDCGTIASSELTTFGNGQAIPVGPETGGREVLAYAEIDIEVAAALTRAAVRRRVFGRYERLVAGYLRRV